MNEPAAWVALGVGLLGLAFMGGAQAGSASQNGGTSTVTNHRLPRGIRNKNPGNIEDNGTPWKGLTGNDGRYIIFEHEEYGIRAMNRILNTYANKYGLNTIRGIINRWAPPVENDTASYIISVSRRVGVGPDVPLAGQHRLALLKAIIYHENGQQPYTDETIQRGIDLP